MFSIKKAEDLRNPEDKKMILETSNIPCPDCGNKLEFTCEMKTDWYGVLRYYRCFNCKTEFVDQSGTGLEIAANK